VVLSKKRPAQLVGQAGRFYLLPKSLQAYGDNLESTEACCPFTGRFHNDFRLLWYPLVSARVLPYPAVLEIVINGCRAFAIGRRGRHYGEDRPHEPGDET
jgi:hypothetical protein